MLKKNNRLSKTKDVKQVIKKGRSYFSPYFILKFLPNSVSLPRLTVIVSTKVSRKAVVRNKFKRQIREVLRKNVMNIKPGDYTIIVKNSTLNLDNSQLPNHLLNLLRNIKSLQK